MISISTNKDNQKEKNTIYFLIFKNIVPIIILIIFASLICWLCDSYMPKTDYLNENIKDEKITEIESIKKTDNNKEDNKKEEINDNTTNTINEQEYECNDNIVEIIEATPIIQPETNEYVQEIHQDNNVQSSNYGTYQITAYTWTGNTMANGEYPYVGCAASCDFPIGTQLYIEGIGTFIIKDVCPTSGVVDIYMNTYDECMNFGRQTAVVHVID